MGTQTTCDGCKKILLTRSGSLDNGPRSEADEDRTYFEMTADLVHPTTVEEEDEGKNPSRRFATVLCLDCAAPLLERIANYEYKPRRRLRRAR